MPFDNDDDALRQNWSATLYYYYGIVITSGKPSIIIIGIIIIVVITGAGIIIILVRVFGWQPLLRGQGLRLRLRHCAVRQEIARIGFNLWSKYAI